MAPKDDLASAARGLMPSPPAGDRSLQRLVAGLHTAVRRLQAELSPVLGSLGVRLIMARAVRQASARHPFLKEIVVDEEGVDTGALLRMSDEEYDQVRLGLEELMAAHMEVLAMLLGEDLALELVRRATPRSEGGGQP